MKLNLQVFERQDYYDQNKPWGNQYWRIGKFDKAILRNIKPIGFEQNLQEIELGLTKRYRASSPW